jgi:glutaredoxin
MGSVERTGDVGSDMAADSIEVYWVPGCSSCLRMKEFIETTGRTFESIDLSEQPDRAEKLARIGVHAPAVVVGDRGVQGIDLVGIAKLIGYDYDPPAMLTPDTLRARYLTVMTALANHTAQLDEDDLDWRSPDNDRSVRFLVAHAATIMRMFVDTRHSDEFDNSGAPPPNLAKTGDRQALLDWAHGTREQFEQWWAEVGHDDPFDRILRTTWGHRTLHEVLERAVWHTAHHVRQLQDWMGRFGKPPAHPLSEADLAGLPLPKRMMV